MVVWVGKADLVVSEARWRGLTTSLETMIQDKAILLVEDNDDDVELMLSVLETIDLTHNVDVVRDGAEALDYLYRRGRFGEVEGRFPAVVFLDLKLPKVDGLEVLRTVKADPKLRNVPIVVFTSSQLESDICRSYGDGVNAYVVKPVDYREYSVVVKDLCRFWTGLNERTNLCQPKASGRQLN